MEDGKKQNSLTSSSSLSSKRAKARWKILRQALLTTPRHDHDAPNETTNDHHDEDVVTKYSIHQFPGFQMISRQIIIMQQKEEERTREREMIIDDVDCSGEQDEEYRDYDIVRYEIPLPGGFQYHCRCQEPEGQQQQQQEQKQQQGNHPDHSIVVHTLEPSQQNKKHNKKKIDIEKELMSHVHYGVDNTGNTRVWDCSNVLAFLILSSTLEENEKWNAVVAVQEGQEQEQEQESKDQISKNELSFQQRLLFSKQKPLVGLDNILSLAKQRRPFEVVDNHHCTRKMLRVLELGAGMAALPSLALAVLGRYFKKWNEQQQEGESLGMYPEIHVTITDGHPKAVANNVACIQRTMGDDGKDNNCSIHCCPLLWKRNEQGRKECQELLDRTRSMVDDNHDDDDYNKNVHQDNSYDDGFDLILVSDCLHFTDFHVDLAMTIGRLLRVGGVCILCQPARGSSVERFLQLIHAMNGPEPSSSPLFQVDLHYRYHSDLYEKHVRLINEQDECYIPDIHYPLWLELKKVGIFCEEHHGGRAINFVHDKRHI